jgi:CubicO group peptidase (beta-lactamase class C family)
MDEWKVPGPAVAVLHNGEAALVRAYGLRDVEAGLKVTTETQFLIGSVTKSFTSTGLALLVGERRLDWKKPVRDYIPEFRLHDAVATDRIHGARFALPSFRAAASRLDMGARRSVTRANAGGNALFGAEDIRSTFQYCNLGYLVASMVAERVSGQSWTEFTRTRLTDKLRMNVTFAVEDLAAATDAAMPYCRPEARPTQRRVLWLNGTERTGYRNAADPARRVD